MPWVARRHLGKTRGKLRKHHIMKNEFTALIEKDGDWFIGYCAEIPGANGQGKTKDECLKSLSEAIELILEDKREDSLRTIHSNAISEMVKVG